MDERREDREEREHRARMEESGRKGGAASMASAGVPTARTREAAAVPMIRDRVRWAPVWAGFLIAIGIQLVLGAIGLAIGLRAYNPASANYAENVSSFVGIWSAISALIALFVGGYIAGRMAAVAGLRNGLAQGSMVWALTLVMGALLSAFGITGLLGAASNMAPSLLGMMRAPGATAADLRNAASSASRGAWYFVLGAVLAWLAAAGGGVLGASQRLEEIEDASVAP